MAFIESTESVDISTATRSKKLIICFLTNPVHLLEGRTATAVVTGRGTKLPLRRR